MHVYLFWGMFSVQLKLASSLPSSCLSLLRAAHQHTGVCVYDTEGLIFKKLAPLWKLVSEAPWVGLQAGTSGSIWAAGFPSLSYWKTWFCFQDWQLIGWPAPTWLAGTLPYLKSLCLDINQIDKNTVPAKTRLMNSSVSGHWGSSHVVESNHGRLYCE